MAKRWRPKFFDDRSRNLDRFGLLLATTIATIVVLSLVDLRPDDAGRASRIGNAVVTGFAGLTVVAACGASGVSRRYRRIAYFVVAATMVASLFLVLRAEGGKGDGAQTALVGLWTLLIVGVPLAVVRRVLRHEQVTLSTLQGAISAYLLIGLTFSFLFLTVDSFQDAQFFGQT